MKEHKIRLGSMVFHMYFVEVIRRVNLQCK